MTKRQAIDIHTTKGHALFMYDNEEDRLGLLADYFQQGLDKNELCIFVTSGAPEDAVEDFRKVGFDARKPFKDGSLRIFEMNSTYLPDGHFAADYMLSNVSNFIADAKEQGFSGLRTAGEMGWLSEHPDVIDEATTYEHNVNSLNTPANNFVGLCLYPIKHATNEIIESAAQTHPSFVYDGQVYTNPHFSFA